MNKSMIKYKIPHQQIESVLSRLEMLEKSLQPTKAAALFNAKSVFGSTELLNTSKALNKPVWKPKPVDYPMIFDEDGQTKVKADIVLRRYMGDSIPTVGPILPLGKFNLPYNNLLAGEFFLGYGALSMLSQNGILGRICGVLAEEMCSKWISFKGVGLNVEEKRIQELTVEFERLNARDIFERANYLAFVFGSSVIYPKIKNDELDNEREEELLIDSIKVGKGDLEYLKVIEPTWYTPIQYDTTNPFDEFFYVPEFYTVIGQITHSSRLFKCTYNEAVDLLKPVYLFNGIPLLQQCLKYVLRFDETYLAVIDIIKRYNISVLKTNIESLIDDGFNNTMEKAASNIKNRIEIFNTFRDNLGTLAISEDEEFQQLNMTLTTLDTLLNQFLELVAIVPGITITKLFGHSLKGMNTTGDYELNNFYDRVRGLQTRMMKENITKVMQLAMLNIWGEIDPQITFEFAKLEETNKLEDSQIRLNNANTAAIEIQNGALTPYDERLRLANTPDSGYDTLEIEEQDITNEVSTEFRPTPSLNENPDPEEQPLV